MRRGGQGSPSGNCETRPNSDLIFLCKDDIIDLNRFVLQQERDSTSQSIAIAVINNGLLEDIVEGQNRVLFGHDPYPTLFEKAAYLLVNFTFHQCFAAGNKRTAWEACRSFLGLNGLGIYYSSQAVIELCKPIAQMADTTSDPHELSDRINLKIREVSEWIRKNVFRVSLPFSLGAMLSRPPTS
jgi:death-on-curing protein